MAYALSETSFIYPISPATSMGETMDAWASAGRLNVYGQPVRVTTMQSEGGAAGAVHGSLAAGGLSSTFTASQGLLLMVPNLYLIAGELMPTVFHVSARTVAKHALSIFNDHSDVMACRQTGFAQLCSHTVQECMDLALVAHLSTLKTRIPFMHFFDGYRTSAQINKINVIPYDEIAKLVPEAAVLQNLRGVALNPNTPIIRGTGQRPDIFMQNAVAAQRYYDAAPALVQQAMDEVGAMTGRQYKLFDYHGHPEADRVVVAMGSSTSTVQEAVDHMNGMGERTGLLKVRLYRPWDADALRAAIPQSAKDITVLDRTREDGAVGQARRRRPPTRPAAPSPPSPPSPPPSSRSSSTSRRRTRSPPARSARRSSAASTASPRRSSHRSTSSPPSKTCARRSRSTTTSSASATT